jgi:hypothetical protein
MKAFQALLLIIGGVGVAVYMSANDKADFAAATQPPAHVPQPSAEPPSIYRTTASQIYRDYDANEVATDMKIGNAVVEMSGSLKSIDKDFTDSAVLHFEVGDPFMFAGATLRDSEKPLAATLKKHQEVTVRCQKMTRVVSMPSGTDCVVVR